MRRTDPPEGRAVAFSAIFVVAATCICAAGQHAADESPTAAEDFPSRGAAAPLGDSRAARAESEAAPPLFALCVPRLAASEHGSPCYAAERRPLAQARAATTQVCVESVV